MGEHPKNWLELRRKRTRLLREILADNLREAREAAGMTQREVSASFDASESYYREIEAGRKEISLTRISELADLFDTTLADLLEGL